MWQSCVVAVCEPAKARRAGARQRRGRSEGLRRRAAPVHLVEREEAAIIQPHQVVHVALRIRCPARCTSRRSAPGRQADSLTAGKVKTHLLPLERRVAAPRRLKRAALDVKHAPAAKRIRRGAPEAAIRHHEREEHAERRES